MDEPEFCPGCGKITETVTGRCPECWYVKHPEFLPAERRVGPGYLDDLGGFSLRVLLITPGLAVALVGIATGSRTVLIIGGVLMAILSVVIRGVLGGL